MRQLTGESELRCVELMTGCTGVGGPICETSSEAVEDRQVVNMLPGGINL